MIVPLRLGAVAKPQAASGRGCRLPGEFAAVRREWKAGDRVELRLPLRMRTEAIDAQHGRQVRGSLPARGSPT